MSEKVQMNETSAQDINPEENINLVNEISNYDNNPSNCLALTVRKDYSLVIVKNIFNTSGRLSWKIVLVTTILNILNMLF